MNEYKFQFRKTFEVLFHGTIEAPSEKSAEKKLRKFAKKCFPEDFSDEIDCNNDFSPLDEGDDFVIYGGNE